MVAVGPESFTGQVQTYDWQNSWWEGQVSFPSMTRWSHDYWTAFISQCRGPKNAFLIGDPKAALPKGSPQGSPVASTASQTGYSLATSGWKPSTYRLLLPGDFIQIGYRLYRVEDQVDSDADGLATVSVWPNLRDAPGDGAPILCSHCKGLFRLKNASGNKSSTNAGNYGLAGFAIREAF
jgi:hypothetical protein